MEAGARGHAHAMAHDITCGGESAPPQHGQAFEVYNGKDSMRLTLGAPRTEIREAMRGTCAGSLKTVHVRHRLPNCVPITKACGLYASFSASLRRQAAAVLCYAPFRV